MVTDLFSFMGASQNNQNLFGSSLGMDGGSNFGKIELLDRNYSEILLSDVTLPNLLHAWWPFDGDGNDYSGNEKHGQFLGASKFGSGRFGKALDLRDGGLFFVSQDLNPGIYENYPRTLSMWIKTRASSGNLAKWGIEEESKKWSWGLSTHNGMGGFMQLNIFGAEQKGMHYQANDGKWRHLALSMTPVGESSFSLEMFMDGRKESKFKSKINTSNFSINTQPSDLFVGGDGFMGWIDDLRIYSAKLNPGEISMIMEEKISDDLAITRGSYSLSAWIKPTNLPDSNLFNFAHARFFWRDWKADARIDTWPHDMRKNGIPQFDPGRDILSDFFEEPVNFYAIAIDNNPATDSGWNTNYIGYESTSISDSNGFFADSNLSDGPWLLENENGGTAYSANFLSTLSDFPSALASSFGTTFSNYGTYPRGYSIAHGSLAFDPDGFAPGIFYLRAGGGGRNTFWLDKNQNLSFELPDERIIRSDNTTYNEQIIFLGHQIPIIVTPGFENDRGLAITGKRSISSWEQNGDEPVSSHFEYSLKEAKWSHVVMVVNRENNQLSTFIDGKMVDSALLNENELPELKMSDWFVGGPGPFNSNQYFAGQIDDLRIYDKALSPEDIARIHNGGEGDIGIMGIVDAPVVTDDQTVTIRISFEKFQEPTSVTEITEADINASLSNGEIVVGSLADLGGGVFEFDATFSSYQQMILDLPAGAGNFGGEDTLRVQYQISRVPEVPHKEDIVHWWWLDESLGSLVSDSVGTSHGVLVGDTSWTADSIFGSAVSFRNIGDHIALGTSDANLSREKFSLSLWFKRLANSTYRSPQLVGNVMLSLGGVDGHSIQIGSGTSNLEVYMNTLISSGNVQMGRGIEDGKWNHMLLSYDSESGDGYELKFYLNGELEGESGDFGSSLVIPPNSKWYMGLPSPEYPDGGRFIGQIDDVRVYSNILDQQMAIDLYNGGLSDHGLTVEPFEYEPVQDPELQESVSVQVKFKRYGGYLSLNDMNIEDLNFTLPTPDQIDDVNLWIDATDSSSVITLSGTNELDYWSNKVNPDVKLYAHPNNRPETGENIGDLNAIDFNRNSGNSNIDRILAYRGNYGSNPWNPATNDEASSGPISDVFVLLVGRLDDTVIKRNKFPFNFGWESHFPWTNGRIFWWFSDNRKSAPMLASGETGMIGLEFSVTNGYQNVFKNGSNILKVLDPVQPMQVELLFSLLLLHGTMTGDLNGLSGN